MIVRIVLAVVAAALGGLGLARGAPAATRTTAAATAAVDDAASPALSTARSLRAGGCGTHAGLASPLRRQRTLDDAARRWSEGTRLADALAASGYRPQQSTALHVRGDAAALRPALARDLCAALTDPRFRDIGSRTRGRDTWVVLAVPFTPPAAPPAEVAAELLARINAARAQPRRCGTRRFPPAPPLHLNALLMRAAAAHARDMLEHDYFAHDSPDGATAADRIAATGYRYHLAGENIAFGVENAAQAVQGWLQSPGHCANIMDPGFRDTGIAYASNLRGAPRIYWVQDFAAPRAAGKR
jgi:uncharacterized protein YkwD